MKKIIIFILAFCVSITPAFASVTMLKTRVIYLSDTKSETLSLKNNDDIPYIMQIWTDINNPNSTPDNADGPFIVQPTIFRIEPKSGRNANLIFTGSALPQDRESLFYLNLVQIPPQNSKAASNELSILLRHRIKIFYRPTSLTTDISDIGKYISFSEVSSAGIEVKNNSPYFLSLTSLTAQNSTGQSVEFIPAMVPPYASEKMIIKNDKKAKFKPTNIEFTYISDLGGKITESRKQ
nr:fimbria/pilus periplasmic chaperone [uncultured Moellerella sp.]